MTFQVFMLLRAGQQEAGSPRQSTLPPPRTLLLPNVDTPDRVRRCTDPDSKGRMH